MKQCSREESDIGESEGREELRQSTAGYLDGQACGWLLKKEAPAILIRL
jgi:hypothetical protein